MTTHEPYRSEGIIFSKKMSIPLNGEPSTVTFLLDFKGSKFAKYTNILKDYSEEFLLECIGQTVEVLLEPAYYDDGRFKGYMITELEDPTKKEKEE